MGCFGSRSGKEVEENSSGRDYITQNYFKLIEPLPAAWNQEIMTSLAIPSSHQIFLKTQAPHDDLKDLNFFLFNKTENMLKENLHTILSTRFSSENLGDLINVISLNYQKNPFHSFYHGFAVCQLIYVVSERNSRFNRYLTDEEEGILLVGALGHDINHPGVNNGFLINAHHALAKQFNNAAVLENYHAATLLDFMSRFEIGVSRDGREKIIEVILGTDMAQHKKVMENFEETMKDFDKENPKHRLDVMRMMIHGADISNPALKFEIATIWSLKIIQEFNQQVLKEERLGLPISEFMRIGNDISKIKRSQISFIDMFIQPLWKSISDYIPNTSDLLENIGNNRKNWETVETLS